MLLDRGMSPFIGGFITREEMEATPQQSHIMESLRGLQGSLGSLNNPRALNQPPPCAFPTEGSHNTKRFPGPVSGVDAHHGALP